MIILSIDSDLTFEACTPCLKLVSEKRQEKIKKLYFEKDKLLSLFAELLARYGIIQKYHIPNEMIQFGYGSYGKPYLLNHPEYHFSLSHSGKCVAWIESPFPVGIDIEQIRNFDKSISEAYFSQKEKEFIQRQSDFNTAFCEIWTKKEAYLKMTGKGLSIALDSFCTVSGVSDYCFTHADVSDYIVSCCIHSGLSKPVVQRLNSTVLLNFFIANYL